ncbi:MAG: hypothetical protein HN904_01305 [Victivallales bacterium]|nr:hypothetical protein [Victivallales bacterium]
MIATSMGLLPALAGAHGFALYVSTPITPPREFMWWFPLSMAIVFAGAFLVLRRVFGHRKPITSLNSRKCNYAGNSMPKTSMIRR